jgi:hypothetical protein
VASTRTRRRSLIAAVFALGVLATASFGSAAALGVNGGFLGTYSATHPCPGTATVTPTTGSAITFSAVGVTVPAGCAGRTLKLTMISGSTVLSGTATVAVSGATVVSFAPTTYNALSSWTIAAVVDGWNLPTTWSFTPPPFWCTVVTTGSTATCTATVTIFVGTKPGGSSSATYYDVVVTTTSTSYVQWEVGFYLDSPFYGARPTRLGNSTLDGYNDGRTNWNGTNNAVTRQSACSVIPLLTVRGNNTGGGNNFRDVRNDRVRQFSLVVNQTAAGYFDVLSPGCT